MPKARYRHITEDERRTMTAMGMAGFNESEIAKALGRSRSTINRERRRNACNDGKYRRYKANLRSIARRKQASRRSHYTKRHWRKIDKMLLDKWSPEQISAVLKAKHICTISHQSIYRYVRRDRQQGGLLYKHLRGGGKRCRKRYGSIEGRGIAKGKRSIDERPESVNNRTTRHHWEADTVWGATGCKHCMITLVERKTGYMKIGKLKNRTAKATTAKIIALFKEFPVKVLTLTCDNGTEFHDFKAIEQALGIKVYFAKPHSAWQRGTNENANGLVRQYSPKGISMKRLNQWDCNAIARSLNNRPRKRLGYQTPKSQLFAA